VARLASAPVSGSSPWLRLALALTATGCGGAPPLQEAALLSSKGQDRAAIAVLRAHLDAHPDAVPERRMLIRLLAAAGDMSGAEREVAALAHIMGPGSAVPWVELGHVLELAHHYDEALAMYDKAAEIAPADATGPRVGGLRAARWGEPELAEPRLAEAASRDPANAEVWHALGLVRLHLGRLDAARTAYASGLRADPNALENRLGLATVALEERDAAGALVQYDRILRQRPGNHGALLGRSWALIVLERLPEARVALAEAGRRGADARVIETQLGVLRALERSARAKRVEGPEGERSDLKGPEDERSERAERVKGPEGRRAR
jgi:tetratricopeptide (TPR) repeat protein